MVHEMNLACNGHPSIWWPHSVVLNFGTVDLVFMKPAVGGFLKFFFQNKCFTFCDTDTYLECSGHCGKDGNFT